MFNQHPTTFDVPGPAWDNPYWDSYDATIRVADLLLGLPVRLVEAMILEQDGYSVDDVLAMISVEGELAK